MGRPEASDDVLFAALGIIAATEDLSPGDPHRKMLQDILQRLSFVYCKLLKG